MAANDTIKGFKNGGTPRKNVVLLLRSVRDRAKEIENEANAALKILLREDGKKDRRKKARELAKNSRTAK